MHLGFYLQSRFYRLKTRHHLHILSSGLHFAPRGLWIKLRVCYFAMIHPECSHRVSSCLESSVATQSYQLEGLLALGRSWRTQAVQAIFMLR